jgi:hypothetical protein
MTHTGTVYTHPWHKLALNIHKQYTQTRSLLAYQAEGGGRVDRVSKWPTQAYCRRRVHLMRRRIHVIWVSKWPTQAYCRRRVHLMRRRIHVIWVSKWPTQAYCRRRVLWGGGYMSYESANDPHKPIAVAASTFDLTSSVFIVRVV